MTDPVDVLAIMAHPDDAELLCAGALIKSTEQGQRVAVLDLTAGEAGSSGTKADRAKEAKAAAEVMGLAHRECANLPDANLVNTPDTRLIVAEHIRALRPTVVVTHWTEGRHPDHRVASQLARDASFLSGLKNLPASGEPHRPEKVVYALAFREDPVKPTFVIDITDQLERKMAALACYRSQFSGKSGIGEVFPGGKRPLFDQIRETHARYGSLVRCEYGEPFWTEETMAAGSLGDLGVSTF